MEDKMKRFLTALVAVALAASVFTGCSKKAVH